LIAVTRVNPSLAAGLAEDVRRVRLVAFDFDGVFTDNMVYVMEDGREAVRCNRSDGIGLAQLRGLGLTTIIISTEVNPVVQARARKLNIRCINGCDDKKGALLGVLEEQALTFSDAAFMGNDVNDLPCLTEVLLPIVVADAHPDVRSVARFTTDRPGGAGAVREVCDLFARVLSTEGPER